MTKYLTHQALSFSSTEDRKMFKARYIVISFHNDVEIRQINIEFAQQIITNEFFLFT